MTSMGIPDATDVPNQILLFASRNCCDFRSLQFFAVMFFDRCGQKPSLTSQSDLNHGWTRMDTDFTNSNALKALWKLVQGWSNANIFER
jgi:hypothetical protein